LADAVLVAHHLSKLIADLVTALARLNAQNLARRSNLEIGITQEKRGERRGEMQGSPCVSLARETGNAGGALD
jgi:hypothetical protein